MELTQEATQFQVGQWVFFEFKLSLIDEMDGDRVTSVQDGCFHTGSWNMADRCVPLSLRVKRISDEFAYHSAELHRKGHSGLNYPDIHNWLVNAWVEACARPADANLSADFERVRKFAADVLKTCDVQSGYGFPLVRPRLP